MPSKTPRNTPPKRAYSPPRLVSYGLFSSLTASGTGSTGEGGGKGKGLGLQKRKP